MDEPGRRRRPDRHRHARRDRLRPCDTVGLGAGNLRDVVRDVSGSRAGPRGSARTRRRSRARGGSGRDPGARRGRWRRGRPSGAVVAELAQRYAALRNAATAAAADTRAAAGPPPPRPHGERRSDGSRGGESHAADTDDPTVGGLADRVRRAAEVLERRIAESAEPERSDGDRAASAIGALVAPEGPWPVFARLPRGGRSLACASSRPPPAQRRAWTPTGSRRWRRSARRWRDSRRFSSGSASPRAGGRCVRGRTAQAIRGRRSPAAFGHRGRTTVTARRRVRPTRRAAGAAGRCDAGQGGRRRR